MLLSTPTTFGEILKNFAWHVNYSAHVCCLEKERGALEKGKVGDVLVVNGNPLESLKVLKNAQKEIHEGVVIRKPETAK